jgi:hypothetical protein
MGADPAITVGRAGLLLGLLERDEPVSMSALANNPHTARHRSDGSGGGESRALEPNPDLRVRKQQAHPVASPFIRSR